MVKFSIIVPVYNVENYLRECVESILDQSYKNYELILINDGSTDKSGSICDEFVISNQITSVIHKKNGGLSDARNTGIERAKGEYIIFIDSDDHIELGTLDKFNIELEKSDNPDVMITRLKKDYEDLEPSYTDINMPIEVMKTTEKSDIVNWMFSKSNDLWPSVRYVVKRDLIKKHDLKFLYSYLHEDVDWTSKLFLYAKTFTVTGFYWYNHRMGRQGSITSSKNAKRTLDVIELVSKNIKDIEYKSIQIDLRTVMFERMVQSLFATLSDYKFYKNEDKRLVVETLYCNREVFKYTNKVRHKIFISFCNIFGFKVGLSIMNMVHNV